MPIPIPIPGRRRSVSQSNRRPSRSPNRRSPIPSPAHTTIGFPSRSPNKHSPVAPSPIHSHHQRAASLVGVTHSRGRSISTSRPAPAPSPTVLHIPSHSPNMQAPIHLLASPQHRARRPSMTHQTLTIAEHGAAQHQGDRPYQEDAYVIAPAARYVPEMPHTQQAVYAVYDGHGGSIASSHAARTLHTLLLNEPAFRQGQYEQALFDAFRDEDAALRRHMLKRNVRTGGCTAVVCVLDMALGTLAVANAGDARCILARKEAPTNGGAAYLRAVRVSKDQNPTDPDERRRIESLGGFITHDGRIGTLNVSRALGDFSYKATPENLASPPSDLRAALRPGATIGGDLVSPRPHVANCTLHAAHTPFLVLGSDGLFARWSDQKIVDQVSRMRYAEHLDAGTIARRLVAGAGEGAGADNCTAIVLFFG